LVVRARDFEETIIVMNLLVMGFFHCSWVAAKDVTAVTVNELMIVQHYEINSTESGG